MKETPSHVTVSTQKKLRERADTREHLADSSSGKIFPLQPIGYLQSCFNQRNGTPRQPLLVPAARAKLVLRQAATPCTITLAPASRDGVAGSLVTALG